MGHGFEYRITVLILAGCRILLSVLIIRVAISLGDLLHPRILLKALQQHRLCIVKLLDTAVGEHHRLNEDFIHHRAELGIDGDLQRHSHLLFKERVHAIKVGLLDYPVFDQVIAVGHNRILIAERIQLLLGPVGHRIAGAVAAVAVGQRIQEGGAFSLEQQFLLSGRSIGYSQRVETIDPFGVHGVLVDGGSHPGCHLVAHGLSDGLAAHCIEVVKAVEHERRIAGILLPQGLVLVHGGEHQAFVDRTAGERAVTDVSDDDTLFAVDLLIQGSSYCNGAGATDDGVVGHAAEGLEEGMHRAAKACVEARLLGIDLSQGAIEHKVLCSVANVLAGEVGGDYLVGLSVHEAFHDGKQVLVLHLVDGGHAFGQNLAMAAVRAENLVLGLQHHRLADRCTLLSCREMGGTFVVVADPLIHPFLLDGVKHRLKLADEKHVIVGTDQAVLSVQLELLLEITLVLVDRNRRCLDDLFFPQRCGIKR